MEANKVTSSHQPPSDGGLAKEEFIRVGTTLYKIVTAAEIDKINILRASILAMHRAVDGLKRRPQHLLIDGNKFSPYPGITHNTVVKGDATFMSIAAASVLAKTYRDDYMLALSREYPMYDWQSNKGSPQPSTAPQYVRTAQHLTTECHSIFWVTSPSSWSCRLNKDTDTCINMMLRGKRVCSFTSQQLFYHQLYIFRA